MGLRRKPLGRKKRRRIGRAAVYFTEARNEQKAKQTCVYAECLDGGGRAGPVWGHGEESVRRALASLKQGCLCRAKFHRAFEYHGARVARRG